MCVVGSPVQDTTIVSPFAAGLGVAVPVGVGELMAVSAGVAEATAMPEVVAKGATVKSEIGAVEETVTVGIAVAAGVQVTEGEAMFGRAVLVAEGKRAGVVVRDKARIGVWLTALRMVVVALAVTDGDGVRFPAGSGVRVSIAVIVIGLASLGVRAAIAAVTVGRAAREISDVTSAGAPNASATTVGARAIASAPIVTAR
jgi:hypothetical protein